MSALTAVPLLCDPAPVLCLFFPTRAKETIISSLFKLCSFLHEINDLKVSGRELNRKACLDIIMYVSQCLRFNRLIPMHMDRALAHIYARARWFFVHPLLLDNGVLEFRSSYLDQSRVVQKYIK